MTLEIINVIIMISHSLAVVFPKIYPGHSWYQATKIFFIFLSLLFLANSNAYIGNGIDFAILNDTSTIHTLA